MLELAEDEQEYFIAQMKKKAFQNVKPAAIPELTILVGAPGSGKSTFAKSEQNAVVVSGDGTIAEYAKVLGIDVRESFYDKEVGVFSSRVNNEIIKEAIARKMNIVYDTSNIQNACGLMDKMHSRGYAIKAKVMLVDEYQAAMNSIERKIDYDKKYTEYRRQKRKTYPEGNPMEVGATTSMNTSLLVEEFIKNAIRRDFPIEIYEFGKKEPSFKTGDDFNMFIENLRLAPIEEHLARAEKLSNHAHGEGRENAAIGLNFLKRQMRKEK